MVWNWSKIKLTLHSLVKLVPIFHGGKYKPQLAPYFPVSIPAVIGSQLWDPQKQDWLYHLNNLQFRCCLLVLVVGGGEGEVGGGEARYSNIPHITLPPIPIQIISKPILSAKAR